MVNSVLAKALLHIPVTLSGIVIEAISVHPCIKSGGIRVTLLPIVTDFKY